MFEVKSNLTIVLFCNAKKKCFCNFFGRICIECYFDGTFVDSAVKLSSYHPTFVRVWFFPLATELFSLHFLCFRCTAQLYLRPFHLLIKLKKNKNIFEFAQMSSNFFLFVFTGHNNAVAESSIHVRSSYGISAR